MQYKVGISIGNIENNPMFFGIYKNFSIFIRSLFALPNL